MGSWSCSGAALRPRRSPRGQGVACGRGFRAQFFLSFFLLYLFFITAKRIKNHFLTFFVYLFHFGRLCFLLVYGLRYPILPFLNLLFLVSRFARGNFWMSLGFLASRFARVNWWTSYRFLTSRCAPGSWWTSHFNCLTYNCYLTSRFARSYGWTNYYFSAYRFACGNWWTSHCCLASRFARGSSWISRCFLTSRSARGNWLTNNCFLTCRFARCNWWHKTAS